jgi:hypothetical protein
MVAVTCRASWARGRDVARGETRALCRGPRTPVTGASELRTGPNERRCCPWRQEIVGGGAAGRAGSRSAVVAPPDRHAHHGQRHGIACPVAEPRREGLEVRVVRSLHEARVAFSSDARDVSAFQPRPCSPTGTAGSCCARTPAAGSLTTVFAMGATMRPSTPICVTAIASGCLAPPPLLARGGRAGPGGDRSLAPRARPKPVACPRAANPSFLALGDCHLPPPSLAGRIERTMRDGRHRYHVPRHLPSRHPRPPRRPGNRPQPQAQRPLGTTWKSR